MNARERFERTRPAITRLDEVKHLIMFGGEDWKPPTIKTRHETSDPTAQKAIYNVDILADKLDALRAEERELEDFIGTTLAIIEGVRLGFGEIYATLLDHRYIDGWTFERIHKETGVAKSTAHGLIDIACDWIDSVGVSRLLVGNTEI